MSQELTGQTLADAYAALFQKWGKVTGRYLGSGWIEISGSGLKPHPNLTTMYPNGWSLCDRIRCSEARKRIEEGYEPPPYPEGD
jgi:hypothetical protein